MASSIWLNNSQATELFCSIIAKFESTSVNKLNKPDKLIEKLGFYSKGPNEKAVARAIKSCGDIDFPMSSFYEMVRQLHYSEPVVVTVQTFNNMIGYVNKEKRNKINLGLLNYLEERRPTPKQFSFENTVWYIYHYDQKKV